MTALLLMGFVSMALLAMASMLTYDARRTRQGEVEAQLRQMLLAATADARTKLGDMGADETQWQVALPAELSHASIQLTGKQQGDQVEMRMNVTLEGKSREQVVWWAPAKNGWILVSVQ